MKAANGTLNFPSYGTADCVVRELLYLKVIGPGTRKTNQAGSMNQHGTEMTKAIESKYHRKASWALSIVSSCWNGGAEGASGDGKAGISVSAIIRGRSHLISPKRRHNLQAVPLRHRT